MPGYFVDDGQGVTSNIGFEHALHFHNVRILVFFLLSILMVCYDLPIILFSHIYCCRTSWGHSNIYESAPNKDVGYGTHGIGYVVRMLYNFLY